MNKLVNQAFIKCHACNHEQDVSRHVYVFNNNPDKLVIEHTCINCSSINSLVIDMMCGLTSIEQQSKRKSK